MSLLTEGVHSGDGTGVVAASVRVVRMLLDRIDDSHDRRGQARRARDARSRSSACCRPSAPRRCIGDEVYSKFPLQPGVEPVHEEQHRARSSTAPGARASRSPAPTAGRRSTTPATCCARTTTLKLSIRIPPRVDPKAARRRVKEALEKDPPYGAKVTFTGATASAGWDAPEMAPWLEKALDDASQRHFGKPAMYMGEGGTIPFMYMLGEKFPKAQFCITGVLGPGSNAHGPNEFLHIPTARKLTLCVAEVLANHAKQ